MRDVSMVREPGAGALPSPGRSARGAPSAARVAAVAALLLAACGGGGEADAGADACATLGASRWVGTESVAITAGSCPSYNNVALTLTVAQSAGSCAFTMTNSRVSGVTFAGTVRGHSVSWTAAPYAYLGGTLTLGAVVAALSTDGQTLSGSFAWTLTGGSHCAGTTTLGVARQ